MGSHCGGMERCRGCDPPQVRNPAFAACRSGMLTEIVRIHIADSFDIYLVVVVRTPDDVPVYFSCGCMSSPMAISSSKEIGRAHV